MLAKMPRAGRSGPGAGRQGEDRVLTVPNALSALRLACLPAFVVLLAQPHDRGRLAAAFLLAAAAFTDLLDGYIARRFDQVSTLGKMADPLVDRALVLCALVGATVIGACPSGSWSSSPSTKGSSWPVAPCFSSAPAPNSGSTSAGRARPERSA